jgi:hypothetical protein
VTGEISNHISGMQETTQESVAAIKVPEAAERRDPGNRAQRAEYRAGHIRGRPTARR